QHHAEHGSGSVRARGPRVGRRVHHREGGDHVRLAVPESRRGLDARLPSGARGLRRRDPRASPTALRRRPPPRGPRGDLPPLPLGSLGTARGAPAAVIPFAKGHGLGNDYVVLEQKSLPGPLTSAAIRRICDRNYGVGSDGILLLTSTSRADFGLRIF